MANERSKVLQGFECLTQVQSGVSGFLNSGRSHHLLIELHELLEHGDAAFRGGDVATSVAASRKENEMIQMKPNDQLIQLVN